VVNGIERFNALPQDEARAALLACCAAPAWASAVLAARPYSSTQALLRESDRAVGALTESDLASALDGHPRIGARTAAGSASSREQAAVLAAGDEVRRALAEGNEAYENRFGHIYLVCAAGRSAAELLGLLRGRLGNDDQTEWNVVAAELAKINQLRLRALTGGAG
jgi:2-oxo-4-hydroxy-4-carboxy-5-ureidoimidazoline decarboxylase